MYSNTDYQIITKIYESVNSLVYRARRNRDNQPIILKILKEDYPTPSELTRYKQEYEITRSLNLDGVVKTYGLEKYQNTLVMLLEDFGGESLDILSESIKFTIPEFLTLSIKIAETLGAIHSENIIHKDINPANIVFNRETGEIKIIDFGISTALTRENPTIKHPNVLEGTLAYISPEQTGRMNRSLDYRTDFYSLGASFYKLLTHQLPFVTSNALGSDALELDPLELVHCHIAKQPIPPQQVNPEIPQGISNIVMKLLAKTAEERYQSAWGLKADLEECLRQLQTKGKIAKFPLAGQDISDKFQIPQKLYGREREIETLLAAFERVAAEKTEDREHKEMMLVAGYSGIGKSVLVQELYKPITQQRGCFISGKFDQFQRNIPYSAFVRAFQSLVQQLLTESEAQLTQWREKLLAAFRANGQVIIDVIPEVEKIVGSQLPLQQLEPTEAQNRFNLVFQNFIRVFCQKSHPLAIFLDDLQWADFASLKLIERMITDDETQYLLLIGAYRDNEVEPNHPLMQTLDRLREEGTIVNQIILHPLNLNQLAQLIADSFYNDTESVKPLAQLVLRKTSGNPFFVNEFLKAIYQENLLTFDWQQNNWKWDIAQIEALDITDNVVDLMVGKLKKLPKSTQQVLCLAACIGNSFDLNTLAAIGRDLPTDNVITAIATQESNPKALGTGNECVSPVYEKFVRETFADLLPAIQAGLIQPTSELKSISDEVTNSNLIILNYKFLHDRVQQAAYTLTDDEYKKIIHLKIGRLLIANLSPEEQQEKIFTIVDHLNQAQELISNHSEKRELAKLNFRASQKAKESTAYVAAKEYLAIARKNYSENIWLDNYNTALMLYKELAEVEYLNGNFERSESLLKLSLSQAKSVLDKTDFYFLSIVQLTQVGKYKEAIEVGQKALAQLGIELPQKRYKAVFESEIAEVTNNLGNRKIISLLTNSEIKKSEKKDAIKLLTRLVAPASIINVELRRVLIVKSVNLSIKFGNAPKSSMSYSFYGMILSETLKNYQKAYEFGLLGLKLSEVINDFSCQALAGQIIIGYLNHWVKHIKTSEIIYNEANEVALQAGDFQYLGYNMLYQILNFLYQGKTIDFIFKQIYNFLKLCERTKDKFCILAYEAIASCLLSIKNQKKLFGNDIFIRKEYFNKNQNIPVILTIDNTFKSLILYLDGKENEAIICIEIAKELLDYVAGNILIAAHNFFYSLILTALYENASSAKKEEYWQQLEINQKEMKIWADNCPENFLNTYLLVAAEIARISGKLEEAMDLYDQAIKSARENEFIQNEAIGNELAAKFWLAKGKEEFAQLYLKKARQCYQIWGAKRKVEDLEKKYPQWLGSTSETKNTSLNTSTTGSSSNQALDLATVMKASQTISGEIVLENLLEKLMTTLIENAGAEKGFLILKKGDEWAIEAEGVVNSDQVRILESIPIDFINPDNQTPILPVAIANYVIRTQENVVLNDAVAEGQFTGDRYVVATQPKSILCTPLLNQGELIGLLYLENNLTTGAFTKDRLEVLNILSSQAAISIQNAQLYVELSESERRVKQYLEALPVGIFVVDANFKPYYANQRAENILGKGIINATGSEKLIESYQAYLTGTEQLYPTSQGPLTRALKGEISTIDDMEIRSPDKTTPLEVSGTPVYDRNGNIVYAIAAFQDITERKQAELQRIRFTEQLEQEVSERTRELSQTLEVLEDTQAKLVFENQLLKSAEEPSGFDYQVGGSLSMDAPTYVVRSADRYLYKGLKRGEFCHILNPRQMGKSSLMVRMIHQLQNEGIRCAAIDLTRIGSENVTPEQWYKGFTFELSRSFGLLRKVNLKTWWNEQKDISPVQRLSQFIEEILLGEVDQPDDSSPNPKKLVIFIDEIDSILGLNFPVNDFFALIRSCYNQRSINLNYQHLTFAFFGVATPSDLITDHRRTPFNIGQAIQLEGFKEHEAQPLLQGLSEKVSSPQTVLKEVLSWTNGQPFLTQKVCQLIRNSSSAIPINQEAEWITELVRTNIIENWESQDEPEHLRTIRDRLQKSKQSVQLQELYREILHQGEIPAVDSPEERELLLSGLIFKQNGTLKVHNRIYKSIFV